MSIKLETPRLILRPIEQSDDKAIYEYAKNPNVGPDAGWKPHESIEETREIMNTVFFKKENTFGIVIKESGKFIGSIGLDKEPKRENDKALMLGYAIGEDYWGCGYTSEAALALIEYGFKTLGMELISAYCYPFNERSKSVIKKLGFKYEGKLSMCQKRFDGLVLDEECYALSAEDYFRPRN
ncbi:MAG: GNAT family N-acetyltransferase [Clostridiales bacterium]|jgi:ribosomal-protein-alanine N-acetyltransferase|nr:GNAT family N-acetyltransferase [Clostridiales bacterium]